MEEQTEEEASESGCGSGRGPVVAGPSTGVEEGDGEAAAEEADEAREEAECEAGRGYAGEEQETRRGLEGEAARLLQQLGYPGPLSNEDSLTRAATSGASCQRFTSLCVWLVSQLKAVTPLEENVSPTEGPQDAETFQLEMSGVVSELHCPYPSLTSGAVTSRLTSTQNCLQLLVFLSTELEAARILKFKEAPAPKQEAHINEAVQELSLLSEAAGLAELSLDIPIAEFMGVLEARISEIMATLPENARSPSLLTAQLGPEQWEILKELHQTMFREYECRMRMLVTRFDVTVKSFHWSERAKVQGGAMNDVVWPLRQSLSTQSGVTLSHLLAAREDHSRILQTCNASFCQKTRSAIQKVMMVGTVPDRGGRPNEIEAPMPTWEKRREGGGGGGNQRWGKKNKKKRN